MNGRRKGRSLGIPLESTLPPAIENNCRGHYGNKNNSNGSHSIRDIDHAPR